jgi:TonB dependent receptor
VDGLELEGGLDLLPGLRAEASFAWMRALLTQNEPLPADAPGFFASAYCAKGCPARAGDPIAWVPKVAGSLTVSYRRSFGGRGANLFGVLAEQYTGSRNTDYAATWQGPSQPDAPCSFGTTVGGTAVGERICSRTHAGDANPAFRTIRASLQTNFQAGYEDRRWRAAVFVDNLLDRRNPIGIAPAFGLGASSGDEWLVNRPRTIGFRLRMNID